MILSVLILLCVVITLRVDFHSFDVHIMTRALPQAAHAHSSIFVVARSDLLEVVFRAEALVH